MKRLVTMVTVTSLLFTAAGQALAADPLDPSGNPVGAGVPSEPSDSANPEATQQVHATFERGDVFVAVSNGQVQWRLPDGTLNEVLDTNEGGFTTGMAFDDRGHLFLTGFSTHKIYEFDTTGTLVGTFATLNGTTDCQPESIVFDAAGNMYVGQARLSDDPGTFAQYSAAIGSDAAGNVLAAWLDDRAPNTEVRARRLPAGGTWGPSQVASDGAADLPSDLALGVAPSGQALAVWADGRGTNWDIWGADYNPSSQLWSVSRLISDDPGTSHQLRPAAAMRGNLSVAVWFDARESYFGDVRASTR